MRISLILIESKLSHTPWLRKGSLFMNDRSMVLFINRASLSQSRCRCDLQDVISRPTHYFGKKKFSQAFDWGWFSWYKYDKYRYIQTMHFLHENQPSSSSLWNVPNGLLMPTLGSYVYYWIMRCCRFLFIFRSHWHENIQGTQRAIYK